MATTEFYFSKKDLEKTIAQLRDHKPSSVGSKVLKGIVFRIGQKGDKTDALFADALYSDSETGSVDPANDVLIASDGSTDPGCPYPPGY